VRAVSLARVAAEAELLRIQHMLKRQGMRAAFGMIAVLFGVGVLVLCDVAGWQVLRWYVQPIYATLVLLGINMVVMAVFGALAARSSPGYAEREALRIRQQAVQEARGSFAVTALLPLAGTVLRSRRGTNSRRLPLWRRLTG
jgi:protein-S-isoprenylcysteine O-methyltransferase Ste14